MKKYFLLPVFVLVLSIPVLAQTVDKAIIATDITSVDLLVAKAAGEKAGIPVLVAENGLLNDDIKSQLSSLGVKTAIIVGGPQVIKPATADELESLGYTVVRLWGIERTGTAIEVAKYFWTSADCAVLADDTKNSDADTELQAPASSLASESSCPLIPVPAGTTPAEVLALLNDMNVTELKIVAKVSPVTSQLTKFKLKIIAGDRKKIEDDVDKEIENEAAKEGKKLKIVIVAAPSWKDGLSIGAHPSERSVVRFVSNASQVPELAAKIKEKNITDVRVVGIPALAQEIVLLLNQSGIIAKVVSGDRAIQVEKKILEELKEKWAEKKKASEERRNIAKIKDKLLERLDGAEEKLNEYEIELQSLKEDGAPQEKIAEIQERIDRAKLKIAGLKADILSNNVDYTNRELAKLLESVMSKRWEVRDDIKIKVRERLADEEGNFGEMEKRADAGGVEGKLVELKKKCGNVQALEDLTARAKSIREEARKSAAGGDYGKASDLVSQAKRVADAAKNVGNVCEKTAKVPDKLKNVAEKRAEKAKKLEERTVKKAGTK
ncbi:MAG: hypothetical protein HYT72_04110 [Candidatus Aenigmarchaeota archaeon]|nr:hypothetical protein [Candidatus Aenigmarchaeota archaeon]